MRERLASAAGALAARAGFDTRNRWDRAALAALPAGALTLAGACAASAFATSGGHFMLPLDDSYIHLQYARTLAAGEPFSYLPGAPPSGGASSPLWVALLTPFFLANLAGVKGAAAAWALCTALFAGLALAVYRLGTHLADRPAGFAAAALLLLNGHLAWNFTNGMETVLFALLLVVVALGLVRQDAPPHGWTYAALAALPLARPEGFALLALLFAATFPKRGLPLSRPLLLFALVPGLLWLLALHRLTGEWKPAGLIAKGLLDRPDLGWTSRLWIAVQTPFAIAFRFYRNIIPHDGFALFRGTGYMPYMPMGLGALALFGGAFAWLRGRHVGTFALLLLWLGGIAAMTASAIPFVHNQRYLAPWTVLATVLAVAGARALAADAPRHRDALFASAVALLGATSLPSVPYWIIEWGRNGSDIFHQHRVMSFTLESLPPGERIAVTDTGVLVYYSQASADDLVGLTTARFARPFLHGEASVLEELARTPADQRPRTLYTYREWFGPRFPLDAPESGAALPSTSVTAGLFLARYPIRWDLVDLGNALPLAPGSRPLAHIDVADLRSERAARYEWRIDRKDERPDVWPRPVSPLAPTRNGGVEGGRFVREEAFDLDLREAGSLDGRGMLLRVRRTAPDAPLPATAARLAVSFQSLDNGVPPEATGAIAVVELPLSGDQIDEVLLPLGEMIDLAGGRRWRVRVRDAGPHGEAWFSFGYAVAAPAP
ncbi:MAG: hypothetical protein SF028_03700 [Candidatus Sumerlaeia bacterium]|nr:hypothetical protein [Candidatus Sumerlaeia bacterium]